MQKYVIFQQFIKKVVWCNMKFLDLVKAGKVEFSDIEKYVNEWRDNSHGDKPYVTLADHLGFSESEWSRYISPRRTTREEFVASISNTKKD